MNVRTPRSEQRVSLSVTEGDAGPRRSLILAGGALRAPYHAGVMRALEEDGVTFSHINASSGGAINLAMLLSGLTPSEMCERWSALEPRHLTALMPLPQYPPQHAVLASGDADAIVHDVFPRLGIDIRRIRASTGLAGTFNVGNFTRKIVEVVPHEAVDLDWIVAGLSLPILLPPVLKGDALYVDPAWIKCANVMESVRRGCDEIWLAWYTSNSARYGTGILQQYAHMLELSANGSLFDEFERIRDVNARIEAGEVVDGHQGPVRLHVVKPTYPLLSDPDFYLGRIDAATLVALGYRDAHAYLANRQPAGVALEPSATLMIESAAGVGFRETLSGPFTLGASNPLEGATRGDAASTSLTLQASIFIRDINAFAAGRQPDGELVGFLSFSAMGTTMIRSGRFLRIPAGTKTTRLVYEAQFEMGRTAYCLTGHKDVTDDPEFDAWTALTTVLMTLHEGVDGSGPVVGAGVARVSASNMLRLVSSISTPGTDGPSEASDRINVFGRLLLGELWARYAQYALSVVVVLSSLC